MVDEEDWGVRFGKVTRQLCDDCKVKKIQKKGASTSIVPSMFQNIETPLYNKRMPCPLYFLNKRDWFMYFSSATEHFVPSDFAASVSLWR